MNTKTIMLAVSAMAILGCGGALDVELIGVHGADDERLELGQSVSLLGEGFFSGRRAQVKFIGHMRRPGLEEKSVHATVSGLALSTEELTFEVSPELLEALGGRGTFHGMCGSLSILPGALSGV